MTPRPDYLVVEQAADWLAAHPDRWIQDSLIERKGRYNVYCAAGVMQYPVRAGEGRADRLTEVSRDFFLRVVGRHGRVFSVPTDYIAFNDDPGRTVEGVILGLRSWAIHLRQKVNASLDRYHDAITDPGYQSIVPDFPPDEMGQIAEPEFTLIHV